MIEKLEYTGYWWLPENPKKRFCGTLKFIPNESAFLDIMGHSADNTGNFEFMGSENPNEYDNLTRPEIIHGISSDGKAITLYRCHENHRTFPSLRFPKQTFDIDVILIGHHFKNLDDIKFKEISVYYSYLEEWVDISGLKPLNDNDNEEFKFTFEYKTPADVYLTENENYKIFIGFESNINPFFRKAVKEFSINQRAYILIKTLTEGISYSESLDLIGLIQDFLTFGTMKIVSPLSISGKIESNTNSDNQSIEIIYSFLKTANFVEEVSSHDMLFSFYNIRNGMGFLLKNWLDKADKLRYIYGLYFSTLYSPTYAQIRFLNYIMAIEGYHRAMGYVDLPKKDHKKRINDVLEAVEKNCNEHKNWLTGRLHNTNEPGLERRLKTILGNYHDIFGGEEEFEEFVKFTYETRNTLVHPEGTENVTIDIKKLHNNTELLKLAVSICLLNVLGFEVEDIKKLMPKMQSKMYMAP